MAEGPAIERSAVHEVYETIATHFSRTRRRTWSEVAHFLHELEPGSIVADTGCGNAKHTGERPDIAILPSDTSRALLREAKSGWRADPVQADALSLPHRAASMDAALSVAVIHHLASPERRVEALAELDRVLAPGGRALVSAWAMEKARSKRDSWERIGSQDFLVPWRLPAEMTGESLPESTTLDDTGKSYVLKRFYHLFREGELSASVPPSARSCVESEFSDGSNWILLLRKPSHHA